MQLPSSLRDRAVLVLSLVLFALYFLQPDWTEWVLPALVLVNLYWVYEMGGHALALLHTGEGLGRLTKAPDTTEANRLLGRWSAFGPKGEPPHDYVALHLVPLLRKDNAFVFAYGALLCAGCVELGQYAPGAWPVVAWVLAGCALAAAAVDAGENGLLLAEADRFRNNGTAAPPGRRRVPFIARLKWTLVLPPLLFVVVGGLLYAGGPSTLLLFAVLLGVLVLAALLQWRTFFLQYLYVCRVPVLLALALVALPFVMVSGGAASLLGNLVVLEGTGDGGAERLLQVFLVSGLAVLTAWTVRFTLMRTLEVAPFRLNLELGKSNRRRRRSSLPGVLIQRLDRYSAGLLRAGDWLYHRLDAPRDLSVKRGGETVCPEPLRIRDLLRKPAYWLSLLLFSLLAVPLIVTIVLKSRTSFVPVEGVPGTDWLWPNAGAALLGVVVTLVLAAIFDGLHLAGRPDRPNWLGRISCSLLKALAGYATVNPQTPYAWQLWDGGHSKHPGDCALLRLKHAQGIAYTLLFLGFVFFVGFQTTPQSGVPIWPALALVLLLMMLVSLLFSFLAVWLDKLRVPLLAGAALLYLAFYWLFATDYTFSLKPLPVRLPADALAATPDALPAAFDRWAAQAPGDTLVVVAAAGGGITSARWTAEVLTRLQEQNSDFDRSLFLISSVSGGTVGALFYLDRYNCTDAPRDLESVRTLSGRASLYAVTHGLLTRDIFRVVPPFNLRRDDRGNDLETTWRARMCDGNASFYDWTRRRPAGDTLWRPLPFFNTTVVETGERVVFAPPGLWPRADSVAGGLPARADLRLATAARLSATFPYVSPLARPYPLDTVHVRTPSNAALDPATLRYHFADGGYYDNDGVTTALEVLGALLAVRKTRIKRIVIVQIQLQRDEQIRTSSDAGAGRALLGPLTTSLSVQFRSQSDRNRLALAQFKTLWSREGVVVDTVRFVLPETRTVPCETGTDGCVNGMREERFRIPLSWQLTRAEEAAIAQTWDQYRGSATTLLHRRVPAPSYPDTSGAER